MSEVLNRNNFFVKEHVGMFKAANNYDILCPETNEEILHCREEKLGFFTKMLRFTKYKTMTPFNVEIKTPEGKQIVRIAKPTSFILSKITVHGEDDEVIGTFKQKFSLFKSKFDILDAKGEKAFNLKGKWTGWDFKFLDDKENELASVSKKWAGLGKALFTSADNYMLTINENVEPDGDDRRLILASVICIDMVIHEAK
jgi:uncharacterized protein YxjI